MHIKQICIQGFKSYKNQTIVDNFSPRHNVIVGRNGSGKSNFFGAIRFALGDAYMQMGREERQGLIHEGAGSAIMSAYVEIIFDNSDDRFHTGRDELILRRTIGLKKDEYSVDRKNATRSDVMNLLASAGFSKSNPYYIVPQGRVTRLTNMKDSERLDLLKSVAGTQLYDEKKEESRKIMNDTDNKLAAIDASFEQINERLGDLEEEQEELRNFQEKDREKRSLEYILYFREQEEINKALEDIDNKRLTGMDDADENRMRFNEGEDALERINQQIESIRQQMNNNNVEKKQLEDERREKAKEKAQIELEVKNMTSGRTVAQQAKQKHDAELHRVRGMILQREKELKQILPAYNEQKGEEDQVKMQLDEAETTRQRLYARQGRNARFKNKKERDDWLQSQINDTFASLSTIKAVRMQTKEDVKELQQTIKSLESEIESLQSQISGQETAVSNLDEEIHTAKEHRDKLAEDRKLLWRQESKLGSNIAVASEEMRKAERALSNMMDSNTSRGLESVRRIKAQYNLSGCYGTLAELIDVPKLQTPVEVTAGNSLFHYIVDNDDTATKVMEILNKDRSGRVTFMPLNRLKPRTQNYPSAADVRPLTELIKFDPAYKAAVEQVFGKCILCPSLAVAAQYARTHGLNAVTPEGDRSDKKGALTGGYYDSRVSRLKATKNVLHWRQEFEKAKADGVDIKKQLERMDQTITRAAGEIQKLEQQKSQAQNNQDPLRQELKSKTNTLRNMKDSLELKLRQETTISANVKSLSDQQSAHEAELSTEFKKALTNAEETQLDNLNTTLIDLRRKHAALSASRSDVEARKSVIEVELNENLRPQLEQLEAVEVENSESAGPNTLKDRQRELNRITKELDNVQQRLNDTEDSLETFTRQVTELESELAETKKEQEILAKSLERHHRRFEKAMQKKSALQTQKQSCLDSIRDLGSLPDDLKTKYRSTNSETIVKHLHKVNESLKKYTKVNKHAFEHYRKSVKQRETLEERRKELETGKKSILELIEVLDQRKDEAIERTFKQVSREFAVVFSKLVPAGRGRLIIQKKTDPKQNAVGDVESDDEAGKKDGVENYTGVGISVSFNSKHDDQQRIQQLSGGQKSLCALTLIFAIQACDTAPFYIFDEIDANLDAQYRTAVAEHLQSLSALDDGDENASSLGGQFICTTFRPEMVRVAEKCYGVTFANNVSSIRVETRARALEFVEGQAQ